MAAFLDRPAEVDLACTFRESPHEALRAEVTHLLLVYVEEKSIEIRGFDVARS